MIDIKECENATQNDCDPVFGRCVESPSGSYTCQCQDGYKILPDHSCKGKYSNNTHYNKNIP